jgi:hypothetical protein
MHLSQLFIVAYTVEPDESLSQGSSILCEVFTVEDHDGVSRWSVEGEDHHFALDKGQRHDGRVLVRYQSLECRVGKWT